MISFETGSLDNANKMLRKVRSLFAGRVAGRSRNVDFASGDDDTCCAR